MRLVIQLRPELMKTIRDEAGTRGMRPQTVATEMLEAACASRRLEAQPVPTPSDPTSRQTFHRDRALVDENRYRTIR